MADGRWRRAEMTLASTRLAVGAPYTIRPFAIRHPPSAIQMCGRFGLTRPDALQLERFGITDLPPLVPRFNIPPSSDILVVRERKGVTGAELIRWGLVPSWAKDPSI